MTTGSRYGKRPNSATIAHFAARISKSSILANLGCRNVGLHVEHAIASSHHVLIVLKYMNKMKAPVSLMITAG